ncbi:hypothetical protein ACLOJK_014336 [Asimina triloba]
MILELLHLSSNILYISIFLVIGRDLLDVECESDFVMRLSKIMHMFFGKVISAIVMTYTKAFLKGDEVGAN